MGVLAQWHGANTVHTGPLDRSALYSGLAQIEALGLDLLEGSPAHAGTQITRTRRQPVTVMAANFGRTSPRSQKVPLP